MLIGANGKVVAKGHPTQLYDLVKKEVMKVERGLPILEGVELDKYKSLAKTVVSNGSNIEAKITPLRKKTDDEEAQAVCAAFDEWLGDAKDCLLYTSCRWPCCPAGSRSRTRCWCRR